MDGIGYLLAMFNSVRPVLFSFLNCSRFKGLEMLLISPPPKYKAPHVACEHSAVTEVIVFTWTSTWNCCKIAGSTWNCCRAKNSTWNCCRAKNSTCNCCRAKNAAKSALPLLGTCKRHGLTMGRDPNINNKDHLVGN